MNAPEAKKSCPHEPQAVEPGPGASDRRVGVEIEFGGLTAREAARIVAHDQGGTLEQLDPHRFEVNGTDFGKLRIELDSKYVHSPDGASDFERKVRRLAGDVGSPVVPTEIVTEPISVDRIPDLDALLERLADAGAVGTQQPHLACGVHLNIEWQERDVRTLRRLLQAYLLLSPDLRAAIAPDRTRTLLPFIGHFPKDYEAKVLDPAYEPDLETFIADYCQANPSKNRELDLLPLLASIDEDKVASALGHPQPAVRPALHYRLPDARLGDPDWSIGKEWERWLTVEALMQDEERLGELLRERSEAADRQNPATAIRKLIKRVLPS
ncbi:amidoligase family protein [Roseibium aggregatum]|uniref:amidoligase family protein n=1 Tax=Roseibium aggregatum TaxID=187304 RepID=UPI001F213AA7|nr:amidoligase family protein [Roseibium aggregatum]